MSLQSLFAAFNKYLPLTDEEKDALSACTTERRLRRRQLILQEGEICKHYTFVVDGCFKKYHVDTKGVEHNLQFIAENDWITEVDSIHNVKPSRMFIEAIEPATVLQIAQGDLYNLLSRYQKMERIFRVIIEDRYVALENRLLQTISETAEERYLSFMEQYSNLSSRLPNTQIASYLGITPEFLSKIRGNLSKKTEKS
ncbi:Crp/Fnr family transcriptional regulator [Danxiaibacter flavus]|uniref:Crp/Fnr family transcriptional regulator n=1 Tax=Danxiaibacter flavus TaxID=3049108 RepID=A0ABV3ZI76_9BACT|nr:Crp/Fnr family transcriptional regulator [Chitinophagaceae bacterium DXS]